MDLLDAARAADLYAELEALRREGTLGLFGASIDSSEELRTLALSTSSGAAEVLFNAFHQDAGRAFGEAAGRGLGLICRLACCCPRRRWRSCWPTARSRR